MKILFDASPRTKILATPLIHRHSIYFFFICTATTAHLLLPYCSIWLRKCYTVLCYCQYSEQLASHASEFVSILVLVHAQYTAVSWTKEHCTMYITIHAFHCFAFQNKHCTLICVHNRIFPKIWGRPKLYSPSTFFGGGGDMAPTPPCGGPHAAHRNRSHHFKRIAITDYTSTIGVPWVRWLGRRTPE